MNISLLNTFQFNWYAVPVVSVGFLMFAIGFFIWLQNRQSSINFSFFLICGCGLLWFLGNGGTYSARTPEVALRVYRSVTFLGVAVIAPAVYMFSSVWLGLYDKQKWFGRLALLGGFAFYVVGLFSSKSFLGVYEYPWGYFPMYGPLNYWFLGFFFVVLYFAFHNFFAAYFKEPKGVRKTQIGLITIGFVVSFFGSVDYIPKLLYYPVYPLGFLVVFFWILLVAYAIIKYKAMNIETVIHQTIMWLATSVIAVLPFAAIIYSAQPIVRELSPMQASVFFFVIALTFYFYFRELQPRLGQLFQRQRTNLMGYLTQFSKDLVHLKNLRDLLQNFSKLMRRRIFVSQLSIYLLDEIKNEFVPAIAKGGLRNLRSFKCSNPFLAWIEKRDNVVVGELVLADPGVETFKGEVIEFFKSTHASVAIPFVQGEKLIGVALLGKRSNLRPYNFAEIRFFNQLKVSVSIALSNSMRFEDIRALSEELQLWNQELEVRVDERTRELVKTQEQLIQAEKLATLGTLAGGVAHEINNPLTAVLTNAQILRMTADDDTKESLELIEEGAKRCQAIVQKLMKYARKTAEEAPQKSVNLNDVVKSTLNLIGFQFKQENVEVVMELGDVPSIPGIANELEQVLTNLLMNARDAVKAANAKGKIEVITRAVKDGVELIVKDNGIGISKENLKKIFDPFYTTKDVGSGTGLGLSVSFGILKRHNATVNVDSELGKGATFVICFPKKQQGTS